MREFTLEQYREMSSAFNKMTFKEKINYIKNNQDIISLCNDYNWWNVVVNDKEIEELLCDKEENFQIESEWQWRQMVELLEMAGIEIKDF